MEINTNLRDKENEEFKEKILSDEIKAEDLVTMDVTKMMNKKKQEKLNHEKEEAAESIRSDYNQRHIKAIEGVYTCRKCKGKRTTQTEMQTRSADEPMTLFITCLDCGNQWKQ